MRWTAILLCSLACTTPGQAREPASAPAEPAGELWIAVFDLASPAGKPGNAQVLRDKTRGAQLADSIRLKLRRQGPPWNAVDRLTMAAQGAKPITTAPAEIVERLRRKVGAQVGLYGTVTNQGGSFRVELACIDLRKGNEPIWSRAFTAQGQRARAILAGKIVQAVTGRELWTPPQRGDEPEPSARQLGEAINVNGDFQAGPAGWDRPDGVSTFLSDSESDRGVILRVRTDLAREPWLAYRRRLRLGQTRPDDPPRIARDTSFGSVAGLEGVHFRSAMIPARPGQRYWLLADHKGPGGAKVFVKGFAATAAAKDGLAESALAELGITPQQFAAMAPPRRRALIEADAKNNPQRYRREVYRWYLNCDESKGRWRHFAEPFPPRGGLPANVEYLQIQIYSYWPPGEYLWDNVHLYADPNQNRPLPEAAPRTTGYESAEPSSAPANRPGS